MVKQYVGARYVPKFATPVEWAADTSYEALTIVTFNNASYTSKIQVPPTVGNPANNPKYWALTGNYNAQVEQYREETEATKNGLTQVQSDIANETQARKQEDDKLQNNINATKQKNLLLIGDSWTQYSDQNLFVSLKPFFSNSYNYGVSGARIAGLKSQITKAKSEIPENITITDIYIVAGTNDVFWGIDENTNLRIEMATVCNTAKSNFPNAEVHYFPNIARTGNSGRNYLYQSLFIGATEGGAYCHPEILAYCYFNNYENYLGSDTLDGVQHLNANGFYNYACWAHSLANGGVTSTLIKCLLNKSSFNVVTNPQITVNDTNYQLTMKEDGSGYVDFWIAVTGTSADQTVDLTVTWNYNDQINSPTFSIYSLDKYRTYGIGTSSLTSSDLNISTHPFKVANNSLYSRNVKVGNAAYEIHDRLYLDDVLGVGIRT